MLNVSHDGGLAINIINSNIAGAFLVVGDSRSRHQSLNQRGQTGDCCQDGSSVGSNETSVLHPTPIPGILLWKPGYLSQPYEQLPEAGFAFVNDDGDAG